MPKATEHQMLENRQFAVSHQMEVVSSNLLILQDFGITKPNLLHAQWDATTEHWPYATCGCDNIFQAIELMVMECFTYGSCVNPKFGPMDDH